MLYSEAMERNSHTVRVEVVEESGNSGGTANSEKRIITISPHVSKVDEAIYDGDLSRLDL